MSDAVDVGNEKASVIEEAQLRRQVETTYHYLIAHCSGDGELVVKQIEGSRADRLSYMEATCGDPVKTKNWAFTHWSFETRSSGSWGKILAGNGEIEEKLRDHIAKNKPRPR